MERSEHSPNFFQRVFKPVLWRECRCNFEQYSILGLFQTAGNVLNCSKAIYGFDFTEQSEVFSSRNVIFTSLECIVAFLPAFQVFKRKVHRLMAPQILNFSACSQWRCPTSVAPDAKSCGSLRMF